MSKTFTCAECGRTFETEWSDQDAEAEALEKWGVPNAATDPQMAVVCDDCFTLIQRRPSGEPEEP